MRPVPRDEYAAKALKTRTLTNSYNACPQWLAYGRAALDAAVASAYGGPVDSADEYALGVLLQRIRTGRGILAPNYMATEHAAF